MRAIIELSDDLRAMVLAVAARKGYRGYSKVIVEALEYYLEKRAAPDTGLSRLLALRGAWSREDAAAVREAIRRERTGWRVSGA